MLDGNEGLLNGVSSAVWRWQINRITMSRTLFSAGLGTIAKIHLKTDQALIFFGCRRNGSSRMQISPVAPSIVSVTA